MQIKSQLRKEIKLQRRNIQNKKQADERIANRLFSASYYRSADTILAYVSLPDEIETDCIIEYALSNNKRVAVPYCVDDDGHMEFYLINSLNDLQIGSFGVREPRLDVCRKLDSFDNSIILVPALSFDDKGYRLGYGKGYYDRFLQNYPFISIGLCYNIFVKNEIPIGEYDKKVDYIVTEDRIISCDNGGKNG